MPQLKLHRLGAISEMTLSIKANFAQFCCFLAHIQERQTAGSRGHVTPVFQVRGHIRRLTATFGRVM